VLDGGATLPEGTAVTVWGAGVRIWRKPGKKKPVRFPLVRSEQPGTLKLTNQRIAEILQEEDLASISPFLRQEMS
jgi:hypothetical protein